MSRETLHLKKKVEKKVESVTLKKCAYTPAEPPELNDKEVFNKLNMFYEKTILRDSSEDWIEP